jgi:hypothetical protein
VPEGVEQARAAALTPEEVFLLRGLKRGRTGLERERRELGVGEAGGHGREA